MFGWFFDNWGKEKIVGKYMLKLDLWHTIILLIGFKHILAPCLGANSVMVRLITSIEDRAKLREK